MPQRKIPGRHAHPENGSDLCAANLRHATASGPAARLFFWNANGCADRWSAHPVLPTSGLNNFPRSTSVGNETPQS